MTIEEEVKHQPTTSGIGYIDYVLWDDNGKPLAIIEAKKAEEVSSCIKAYLWRGPNVGAGLDE